MRLFFLSLPLSLLTAAARRRLRNFKLRTNSLEQPYLQAHLLWNVEICQNSPETSLVQSFGFNRLSQARFNSLSSDSGSGLCEKGLSAFLMSLQLLLLQISYGSIPDDLLERCSWNWPARRNHRPISPDSPGSWFDFLWVGARFPETPIWET
jgi:hypothetical protein